MYQQEGQNEQRRQKLKNFVLFTRITLIVGILLTVIITSVLAIVTGATSISTVLGEALTLILAIAAVIQLYPTLSPAQIEISNTVIVTVVGIAGGIVFGIAFGPVVGIVIGTAFGIASIPRIYRVLFYLTSNPSILYAYLVSRKRPREVRQILHKSSLHWDELVYLPLPFLKQMLLIACDQDLQGMLEEIAFIDTERPQQLGAARTVVFEIAIRDLESRTTIQLIVGAAQRLNELLPPGTKLSDPRRANALHRLSDASREMVRSMQPIGRQERLKSLDKVINNLDKLRSNVVFSDQDLNRRLKQVIETWLAVSRQESERLERDVQDIGNIENPYKPGQVLDPHDPLFVGRRDLAVQLEYALSKGIRRPTLLLQGERRMGKTSTLLQLSHLLGTSYVPIVYNLQDPKIYARTTTFLGTFASGIYEELLKRGTDVEPISFAHLLEPSRISDSGAYSIFDQWLEEVEMVLEVEERLLLLAFDEFEKLDEADERGNLDLPLFLDWCRQIIQYRPRIILLFSGVHTFSNMGVKSGLNWSSYFVNAQTFKVSFLNSEEARHLILHPRPDYPGAEIFGAVVEQIVQQTNCHPFLVQALCSQLVDTLNVEKREQIESADVLPAVKEVVKSWDGYFDDLWKRCDEPQRACLLALEAQEGDEGMTLNDIQRCSQLDEKSIRQVLRTLVSRDLVIDSDDGMYRIAAPIFRRWVKYNS